MVPGAPYCGQGLAATTTGDRWPAADVARRLRGLKWPASQLKALSRIVGGADRFVLAGHPTERPTTMLAIVVLTLALAATLAILARELRGGGYGRPSVPSIPEVGAERTKALSSLARSDVG
jgi:hypothetical protein